MKPHPWFDGPEPKHQREIRENGGKPVPEHPKDCICPKRRKVKK